MNAIDALFQRLRETKKRAFMPFLTAGDPDAATTARLIQTVVSAGANLVEVGFPFSDPIADGPVIQASYTRALDKGLKIEEVFASIRSVTSSPGWTTPIVGMVSYSLIFRRGVEVFLDQAIAAGLSGAIVPDLPAEESEELAKKCKERDFKLILLVTPTTSPERSVKIVQLCTGFLYCVSVVGITGERDRLPVVLREQLQNLRKLTPLPLCVGFGVSKPEHIHDLREVADGVIVGSALVRRLEQVATKGIDAVVDDIHTQVSELVKALNG